MEEITIKEKNNELALFSQNKVMGFLTHIKDMALDGDLCPLEAYKKIKDLEDHAIKLRDELKSQACDVAMQNNKQIMFGYEISYMEKPTYSFEHIEEWAELKGKMKAIEEKAKLTYKLTGGSDSIEEETGEIIKSAQIKSIASYPQFKKIK